MIDPTARQQELTFDLILSLDGCAAGDGWPGWWGLESPEYLDWLARQPEQLTVMGATTYRTMSAMAEQAASLEIAAAERAGFAQLTQAEKVVFSGTLEEPLRWPNTRLISSDAVDAVRELKRTSSRPLGTLGSIRLGHSLMQAGVVDRFRIVLFPVITGRTGLERVWERFGDFALQLLASRTFEGGLQLLEYRPTPLAQPPGSAWQRDSK
ncbi:dihydrofolate reductase family protein [Cumulibacter manganitolerans]|uniref:dihydrofolate reductase family protein n=1 Tax=Cumulibacter manganitolerans TaxID=1884992 RepID=UPI001295B05F|nr:dihydrofolate reductase family protein [Cumulibacter manganitolerans]